MKKKDKDVEPKEPRELQSRDSEQDIVKVSRFATFRFTSIAFFYAFASIFFHTEIYFGCFGLVNFGCGLCGAPIKDMITLAIFIFMLVHMYFVLSGDKKNETGSAAMTQTLFAVSSAAYFILNFFGTAAGEDLFFRDFDVLLMEIGFLCAVVASVQPQDWGFAQQLFAFATFRYCLSFVAYITTVAPCASLWDFSWLLYAFELPEPSPVVWYLRFYGSHWITHGIARSFLVFILFTYVQMGLIGVISGSTQRTSQMIRNTWGKCTLVAFFLYYVAIQTTGFMPFLLLALLYGMTSTSFLPTALIANWGANIKEENYNDAVIWTPPLYLLVLLGSIGIGFGTSFDLHVTNENTWKALLSLYFGLGCVGTMWHCRSYGNKSLSLGLLYVLGSAFMWYSTLFTDGGGVADLSYGRDFYCTRLADVKSSFEPTDDKLDAKEGGDSLSREYTGGSKGSYATATFRRVMWFARRKNKRGSWVQLKHRLTEEEERPGVGILPFANRMELSMHNLNSQLDRVPVVPPWVQRLAVQMGTNRTEAWSMSKDDKESYLDEYDPSPTRTTIQLYRVYYDIDYDMRSNRWWEIAKKERLAEFDSTTVLFNSLCTASDKCEGGITVHHDDLTKLTTKENVWVRPWVQIPWREASWSLLVLLVLKCLIVGSLNGSPKKKKSKAKKE